MFKVTALWKSFSFKASQKHWCARPTITPTRSRGPFLHHVSVGTLICMPVPHRLYPFSLTPSALQWLHCVWNEGYLVSRLKAVPFLSGGVEGMVVSVMPFPCLHKAVPKGLGGFWFLLGYDQYVIRGRQISALLSCHLWWSTTQSFLVTGYTDVVQSLLLIKGPSLSLWILSLGNAEYDGFSLSPADSLAQLMPIT